MSGESLPIARQAGTDLGTLIARCLAPVPARRPTLPAACCELERLALAAEAKRRAGHGLDALSLDPVDPFAFHVHRSLGPGADSGGGVVYAEFASPSPPATIPAPTEDLYAEFG